ncbi:hypothetical protein GCM10010965_27440 [Caldalkalibacillus thermarum]|nr:hypothetical protein GCM10010965_27440 [Caldalkalibacillus thermarum]
MHTLQVVANQCPMYFRFGKGERGCQNCLWVKNCNRHGYQIIASGGKLGEKYMGTG